MYDVRTEAGVIGTLLVHPRFYYHFEQLKPEYFYEKTNAVIFDVIKQILDDSSEDVSDFSVYLRIAGKPSYERQFLISDIDIQDYLDKLKLVATSDEDEYRSRCKRVIDYAFKRDSIEKLKETIGYIETSKGSANEVNMHIHDTIDKFSEEYIVGDNIKPFGEVIDDLWEEVLARQNPSTGMAGIPSKIPAFNKFFTYEKGELILVSSRAKAGKSFLGLNEAIHKLKNGIPTAIFDTEMQSREFLVRALSNLTGILNRNIKTGVVTEKQGQELMEAREWLKKQPFVHKYDPDWNFDSIYLTAKELQKDIGLEFLIYDYIKAANTINLQVKEHNFLGDMTNFLKNNVAGKLDLAMLTFAQMSPYEARVADSDKINRYASVVAYFMEKTLEEIQTDGKEGGNRKLIIDYNRLGEQFEQSGMYINLMFDGNRGVIAEAPMQPKNEFDGLFN